MSTEADVVTENRGWIGVGRVLLLLAIGLAVYLGISSLRQDKVAGCDHGGCDLVLSSHWSQVLGVPVALLGALIYIAYFVLDATNRYPLVRSGLAIAIVGAALWFVILQAFVVRAFCPWCCTTHGAAVLGLAALKQGRGRWRAAAWRPLPKLLAGGLAPVLLLALLQAFGPKPATTKSGAIATQDTGKAKERFISLHDGKFRVEATALPSMGPVATAEHVIVGLFDYTCPHCRKLHATLHEVRKSFGDRLAVTQMPGKTSDMAVKIQQLMLTAWKIAPDQFQEVANLIYTEKLPADDVQIRAMLASLIGEEQLKAGLAKHTAWADSQIALTEQIRQANKPILNSTRFPQLIIGKHMEAGERDSAGDYFKLLADHLGLKRAQVPRLAVVPSSYDLGKIASGSKHEMRMEIANPGSVVVTVEKVKLPPGMRFTQAEPEKLALAPGQTATVEIEAEAPPTQGKVGTGISVLSDSDTPEVKIPVNAEIFTPIKLDPKAVDFGDLRENPGGTAKVSIVLEAPAKLGQPICNVPEFSGSLEQKGLPTAYELTVRAAPNLSQMGYRRAVITISVAPENVGAKWPKEITVPIRGHVLPPK